jgi:hypothetical protein
LIGAKGLALKGAFVVGAKGLALKGAFVVGAKGLALKGALLEPDGMLVVSELTFDVTILDKGRV